MSEIEFPYEPTLVQDYVDYYRAEHHNRQARQLAGLTDRVNRFWEDDTGRPTPDATDKYPVGFNEARAAYEFWDGTTWLQLPNASIGSFVGLTDTPSAYTGQAGKLVAVKSAEDGLEFVTGGGGASAYAGSFEQPTPPTVLQIPDGKWGFWFDTDDGSMILVRNRGNFMFGVEATQL